MMSCHETNAVQLRITLDGIEPVAWRTVVVPTDWHLGQLHLVIQAAFNWWNYHLHEFRIGGLRYGDPEVDDFADEDSPKTFDESEVSLRDLGREAGTQFTYVYDFGDDWNHVVEIERFMAIDPAPKVATCTDGARARPPEDVGGPPGYENFLAVMADRSDPEHRDTKRWCGGHFDPDWFDLALVDKDVRAALRPNVRRRQFQPKPPKPTRQGD